MNMKKNLLFVLGTAAILASCSNDETTNSREVIVPKSDVAVSLGAESNIAIEQTRAVVDKWAETPIYVWGLDKAEGADWTTTTSNLFSPASYVPGIVTNTTDNNGTVKLGNDGDLYFYPLSSDVNFSFYACSPAPTNPPSKAPNSVTVSYEVTGNKDILWGEAIAEDITVGNETYSGYNARYFRKEGRKPILKFEHKLTQLIFKGIKGDDSNTAAGDVKEVQIKNITVKSFLYYVPYVTLAIMTFPAILSATSSIISAAIAFVIAIVLAWIGKSLFQVAMLSCASVFIVELVITFLQTH